MWKCIASSTYKDIVNRYYQRFKCWIRSFHKWFYILSMCLLLSLIISLLMTEGCICTSKICSLNKLNIHTQNSFIILWPRHIICVSSPIYRYISVYEYMIALNSSPVSSGNLIHTNYTRIVRGDWILNTYTYKYHNVIKNIRESVPEKKPQSTTQSTYDKKRKNIRTYHWCEG